MRFLDRLERNYGRWAIPNVTIAIMLGQVFLYILDFGKMNEGLLDNAALYPNLVLKGEIWRLVSFLFVPPSLGPLFAFFYFSIFYMMGSALESHWGTFRYNLYLLLGTLSTIGAAFLANVFVPGMPAGNWFMYGTVFLAFATLYPEYVFHIMLILPVKVKWLALLTWVTYFYSFFFTSGWTGKLLIAASLLNYFCFFGLIILRRIRSSQRRVVDHARQAKAKRTPRHVCCVCGVTNLSDPKTQFRYCSKCEGACAYCTEHIHDHEHVIAGAEPSQR